MHTGPTIHPSADVDDSATVGDLTRIWANVGILALVRIGAGCSVGRGSEIGRGSIIGDRTRIGWGCFFPPNSIVGEGVFVGPGVVCTDDRHPKVPEPSDHPYTAQPPIIEDFASIGARSVLLPGVRIGRGARVGAGSIVTHDVAAGACVYGVPAREHAMPPAWVREDINV